MKNFNDHFSSHSSEYSMFRPVYPDALYKYLASLTADHKQAWDCGTGNGQAAHGLVPYYDMIIATDASETQIANASLHKKINFRVAAADNTDIESESVDLVTVAQALHWFNTGSFYGEVERVLKNGGIFSAWTYRLPRINSCIDQIIDKLHYEIIADYWPPERSHVDQDYQDIVLPFSEQGAPAFEIIAEWSLERFLSYINTWSGVVYYKKQNNSSPIALIYDELVDKWGDVEVKQIIRWPITLRTSKK